jgi:coenzyme Q-binding protein COQ10
MPKHIEERISNYSSLQLFNLVADIESYPHFLPWCAAARILEKTDQHILAELSIGYKGLLENYTSKVTFQKPSNEQDKGLIIVKMVEGPFQYLTNNWEFSPNLVNHKGCSIKFSIDFAFKSKLLESLIGSFFERAVQKMVMAFEERAKNLYN